MTEVAFHFNLSDKLGYVCRLLRKGTNGGTRFVVTGTDEVLHTLDLQLWTFSPTDFVAHTYLREKTDAHDLAPVVLSASVASVAETAVLVNLGSEVPDGFERFARLIELVSTEDPDRQFARRRWSYYNANHHPLQRHDLAAVNS